MADDSFVEMPARSSMWPVLRRLSCGHCNGLSVSPERQDHHEMIIQVLLYSTGIVTRGNGFAHLLMDSRKEQIS